MNNKSLKLAGRIVSVNHADQSFLIESNQSPNRRHVYANDALFTKLNRTIAAAQFNGGKGREMIGTFHIQGKVLTRFKISCFEPEQNTMPLSDFVRMIIHAIKREPSK